ncbi:MAG: hypothetical protein BGO98_05510 [Myxococcales bacterium 68-20]|nr:hypothetical protein [Myxococcales bacterium]OJY28529.1 MAG: hypothetical protein BGO98_05510 [Myxococcales bacterium 68-20]
MAAPNVYPLFALTIETSSVPVSAVQAIAHDSEGPASGPTILVEVDDEPIVPTALPAPPPVPVIALEDWRPPPPSRLPTIRPSLVQQSDRISRRPTVRVVAMRSRELARPSRCSEPPTMPPPSPALRRVA